MRPWILRKAVKTSESVSPHSDSVEKCPRHWAAAIPSPLKDAKDVFLFCPCQDSIAIAKTSVSKQMAETHAETHAARDLQMLCLRESSEKASFLLGWLAAGTLEP